MGDEKENSVLAYVPLIGCPILDQTHARKAGADGKQLCQMIEGRQWKREGNKQNIGEKVNLANPYFLEVKREIEWAVHDRRGAEESGEGESSGMKDMTCREEEKKSAFNQAFQSWVNHRLSKRMQSLFFNIFARSPMTDMPYISSSIWCCQPYDLCHLTL